jgi:pyrroloquinoline quinone (PQQ) biosynthesis protein C
MAPEGTKSSAGAIADQIVAIRERWHTKKHPFFLAMAEGSLPLEALGIYMANHFRFVEYAVPGMGLMYFRAPNDVRQALVENMAEEHGVMALPGEGHEPHDHFKMIVDFCEVAGLSEREVRETEMPPAWWARSLHYLNVLREEPIGVALAMQSTQEGQQVALNNEVTIPAFEAHYGFTRSSPEIAFFVEHAEADLEHSARQLGLAAKYLDTLALRERALKVCDTAVRLRWASITDLHRKHVLGEADILPEGVV